jgi:hypothetical protein
MREFEGAATPKFLQASLRDIVLYFSEHHGDGSPGVHITIEDFEGLKEYYRKLTAKRHKYNRPSLKASFWDENSITMTVIDPVGNKITFGEKIK